MPENLKNELGVFKRKVGSCIKELEKTPAIPKSLVKSFNELFNSLMVIGNTIETVTVKKEK